MLSSEHQVKVAHDVTPVVAPVLWLRHFCDSTAVAWQSMAMMEQALLLN
jgi:hypothetical protein